MKTMKRLTNGLMLAGLLFGTMFFTSCNDDDEEETLLAAEERIVGTWVINESQILGNTIPGDGSTITFNACTDTGCTGSDYLAADASTSDITYTLNADATLLTIDDSDPSKGGSYTGEYTIVTFTNSSMTITIDTFLGPVTFKMTKQ